MSKPLQWDVFVSAGPPVVNADFGPGVTELALRLHDPQLEGKGRMVEVRHEIRVGAQAGSQRARQIREDRGAETRPPQLIGPGEHALEVRIGRRKLPPVKLQIVA